MEQNLAKPKQAAAASDLLSHLNLIRHSFVMCPPGQTYHLDTIVTHQEAHLRNVLFQNLSLDFTRVFHETSCERSQSRRRRPQPPWPSPAQSSAAWSSVSGWRQIPPAFFLLYPLFSLWSISRLAPNLIILLAKTGGIYNYIKVVIDTFLFFPNVYYFSLDNRPAFWALSSIICVIKRSRTRCLLIIIIYEYVLIDIISSFV